jgi:cytoskeletal protein RodZ
MGTEVRSVPETTPLDAAETSIGRYLARQRELRGISLDELALRTKIPIRSLTRLESGAFDAKPDGFARGFVRTVAVALGLDADEAVTRLLAEPRADVSASAGSSRPLLAAAAAAALALIAAGVVWRAAASREVAPAAAPAPNPEWVLRQDAVRSLAAGDVTPIQPSEKVAVAAAPRKASEAPKPKPVAEAVAASAIASEAPSPPAAPAPVEQPAVSELAVSASVAASPDAAVSNPSDAAEDTRVADSLPEVAGVLTTGEAAAAASAGEGAGAPIDSSLPAAGSAAEAELESTPAAAAPVDAQVASEAESVAPATP